MQRPAIKLETSFPRSTPDLDFELDGDLFVVQQDDVRHYLNPSAAILLQLCDGVTSIDSIIADLAEVYGQVPDLDAHVHKCLDDLERRGLLTR